MQDMSFPDRLEGACNKEKNKSNACHREFQAVLEGRKGIKKKQSLGESKNAV